MKAAFSPLLSSLKKTWPGELPGAESISMKSLSRYGPAPALTRSALPYSRIGTTHSRKVPSSAGPSFGSASLLEKYSTSSLESTSRALVRVGTHLPSFCRVFQPIGWNTRQKDAKWVPTLTNARDVLSKLDVEYFSKSDADPKEGPAELGTFRECVVPILEYGKADLVSAGAGPYRLNDFIEIDSAPGNSPGHVFFKLDSKGEKAAFIGYIWHHLLQVYYPDWNFPKNSDAAQARVSRRKVLDYCAASGALVFPGHVGLPFAGRVEKAQSGFRPHFEP